MYCRIISECVFVSVVPVFVLLSFWHLCWASQCSLLPRLHQSHRDLINLTSSEQLMCSFHMQAIAPMLINIVFRVYGMGQHQLHDKYEHLLFLWTWDQACTPAEFKHIDKRRKIHNVERLQSLRMNEDWITVGINDLCIELLYIHVLPFRV